MHVEIEQRALLLTLGRVLPAKADDLPDDLRVEAAGLRLSVYVADVVGDSLLLFVEPLNAFDEALQFLARYAA